MTDKQKRSFEVMKHPDSYLEWTKIKRLIRYARQDSFRNYLILRLLLGRRVSEVVRERGIRPKDIREPDTINFFILKRKEPKRYPIKVDKDLIEKLKGYVIAKNIKDDEPLFKISRQRVFQIVRKYGKECGCFWVGDKRIHPHHFRHSYAIWFVKNADDPMDIYSLQKKLKHTDVNMTMWYLRNYTGKQKETGLGDMDI